MIISVHIRKAAGTSFRKALLEYYGDKLLLDYGDEIGSSRLSSRKIRLKTKVGLQFKKKYIAANYSIVHGHFFSKKYSSLNAQLDYVTFLRDPVDRVLSNYFYLKRNKDRRHGDAIVVNKYNYGLEEYICHRDAKDVQSQFLAGLPLSEFSFVGLTEEYEKSIRLFNRVFDVELSCGHNENFNPKKGAAYNVSADVIELIEQNNKKDIELYNEAKEIFKRQYEVVLGVTD